MSYVAKHAAAPKHNPFARLVGACAVAGAAVVGGIGAQSASAAAPTAAKGSVWDRVAACESGGNWSISTGNGYFGGLQFSASSWRAAGGTKYANLPHRATKGQQIATAQNLLRMQGPGAWPVCSRKAGLTRANGLAGTGAGAAAAAKVSGRSSQGLSVAEIKKLQRKAGVRVDGIVGPQTVRGVQKMLGLKRTGLSYFTKAELARLK